jgi:hypothetical protein
MDKQLVALAVATACLMLVLGCNGDSGTEVQVSKSTVVQTSPQDGAVGVRLIPAISISFSEEMDESTLGGITVGDVPIHSVDYDTLGNKVTVHLAAGLAGETAYMVTVPSSVKDAEGYRLGTAHSFSFTTGPATCDNAADDFEPNDSPTESVSIEIPCSHPVLSSCGGDERADYYDFTVEEAAEMTFRLRRVDGGPSVRWAVNVLRHPLVIFSVYDSLKSTEEVTDYYTCSAGTYTLKVGKREEDQEIVFYSLALETSAPCVDDSYEDNDNVFEAPMLPPGHYDNLISCHNDNDFYGVDLTAGQTLTVTASNVSGGSPYGSTSILDSGYRIMDIDSGTHTPLTTSYTAAATEVHWVKVTWEYSRVEYTLDIEVE